MFISVCWQISVMCGVFAKSRADWDPCGNRVATLSCQRTAVDRQCIVCDLCCGTSADRVFLPGAGKPVGDGYAVVWYLGNDDAGSCMGA